jgi:pantoate kinase
MTATTTYCPAALSFIFKSCPHADPARMGSIGVGCTIDKGIKAAVSKSKTNLIMFNRMPVRFPTVSDALANLTSIPFLVALSSPLPLGYGFGLSGASALACLYAANTLLQLHKTKEELNRIAHIAEIRNGTGLGTVATETTGGFLVKNKPGIPAVATSLPFIGQKLYTIVIDKLLTPTVLSNKVVLSRVSAVADRALDRIRNASFPTLADIIDISYAFVKESNIVDNDLDQLIQTIRKQGIHATMAILGKVIICDKQPSLNTAYRIEKLTITDRAISC